MARTLALKLEQLKAALKSLAEALSLGGNDFTIVRDSAIKRFEYCFELSWKASKEFLRDRLGVDVFSPKECWRELKRNQIIDEAQTEKLLQMTDDRNNIVHTYNEQLADILYQKIKQEYYQTLKNVYQNIKVYS